MRGKGINYDTGFSPGGHNSREHFDADVVRAEMSVIARELRCTAVRISGGEPGRLSTAGELAAAEGLEVWFAPFPCELTTDQLAPLFADCADRAEHLRRAGANVVLVTGCELTLFAAGFLPGGTVYERIQGLQSGGPQLYAAYATLPGKLNGFLATTAEAARGRFGGPLTYASGMWEPVDWGPFDIAATDAYRDAGNAGTFRSGLRKQLQHGKPLAVTEFGCCAYVSAGDRGGMAGPSSTAQASTTAPARRAWTATTCVTNPSRSGTWRSCTASSPPRAWTGRSGSPSPATGSGMTPAPGATSTWPATAW
jgi:hypothetical protein